MPVSRILYIGNQLQKHGLNPTTIDLLAPKLAEHYEVITASDQQHQFARLVHMLFTVLRYYAGKHKSIVLIDVYSTKAFYYFVFVAGLCRLLNYRYVPVLHGGNLPQRLVKNPKLCRWLFKGATCIVSPSLFLKHEFLKHDIKTAYIPNFIELNKYPFALREHGFPRILFVRSFASIYNPVLAIEVLKSVQQDFPEAVLCMVGPDKDGTLEVVKARVKEYELEHSVTFTGRLAKEEWIKLSGQYNVFINTTFIDNMPVSLVEAMALGLPVVSTNVGGIPYLVTSGVNGLLCKPGDTDEMVSMIKKLFEESLLYESLVHNGRLLAESLDWKQVSRQWMNLFQSLHESET